MKPYLKAAVTFTLAYLGTLIAQQQGVDPTQLSGADWARAGVVALVTTAGMFFTKYQTTKEVSS
jgi:hypothetical protein